MRKLTGQDMANLAGTTIKGHKIRGCRIKQGNCTDSDHYGIILAESESGKFVTWQFHLEGEQPDIYWGHYFMEDYEAALYDFNHRDKDKTPELSTEYWDCECDSFYIHPNSVDECLACGAKREEMPDSHQCEVDEGTRFASLSA